MGEVAAALGLKYPRTTTTYLTSSKPRYSTSITTGTTTDRRTQTGVLCELALHAGAGDPPA